MHPLSEIEAVFICRTCNWLETDITRMIGIRCNRCLVDGMDVATDPDEIKQLPLKWCSSCKRWHGR
jgi:hypothetical protein